MEYQVNNIVTEIRVALDQNMSSAALTALSDVDTLSLEEIVRSKVVDAVRQVELIAPLWQLGRGIPFGASIAWDNVEGIGSGYVLLPPDFMRLLSFQMTDWVQPVFETIEPGSPKYQLQSSRFPGLRGNPQSPVVALVNRSIGRVLEFYSCTGGEGTAIKQANYLPEPRIVEDKIYIPYKVKDAVVYYAAYLVALATEQVEQAKALLAVSQSLINNQET